jgi:hypothetical protein
LQAAKRLFDGPVVASMSFSDEPAATNNYGARTQRAPVPRERGSARPGGVKQARARGLSAGARRRQAPGRSR